MDVVKRTLASIKRGDQLRRLEARIARILDVQELDTPDLHAARNGLRERVLTQLNLFEPLPVPGQPRQEWRCMLRAEDMAGAERKLAQMAKDDPRFRVCLHHGELVVELHGRLAGREVTNSSEFRLRVIPMTQIDDAYVSDSVAGYRTVPRENWNRFYLDGKTAPPYSTTEPQMPIDLVYTWVDGADPKWQERKRRALANAQKSLNFDMGRLHTSADSSARYESFDELLYSMRSVEMFASWINRIYIVTDNQTPAWLMEHPKISVVSHSGLIGHSVYNSHAIEASLHRIPDLSEHYLYLNDDMFFGQMAYPSDFYAAEGVEKFFPSDLPIDLGTHNAHDLPIMAAAKNGRDLIAKKFGIGVQTKVRHTVYPQIKSVAEDLENWFPEHVKRTRNSLLRSPSDISIAASLQHWCAYATGRAVPATLSYLYLNLANPGAVQKLEALESLRRYPTFCLNLEEQSEGVEPVQHTMSVVLSRYFPRAAAWENIERMKFGQGNTPES